MENSTIKSNLAHLKRKLKEAIEELDNVIDLDELEEVKANLYEIKDNIAWMEGQIK